jgi:hypothetical protein
MDRFVGSLSDQTKNVLIWLIHVGLAFTLFWLSLELLGGLKWLFDDVQ